MRGSRAARAVAGVAATAAVVVLLMLAAGSGAADYAERGPSLPWNPGPPSAPDAAGSTTAETVPPEPEPVDGGVTSVIADIAMVVAVVMIAIGMALFRPDRRAGLRRWAWGRSRDDFDIEPDRLDAIAAAVGRDAAAQRAVLLGGEPRNAIVESWSRLERQLADAGVERRPTDTSTDLVVRTLDRLAVDPDALGSLAALYREARFSAHPIGESQRRAALAALDTIHAGFDAPAGLGARPRAGGAP